MKNIQKYIEIYILILLTFLSAILIPIFSVEKYKKCEFYLGYTVESEKHNIVLWNFNNDNMRKYSSFQNLSEQYLTSYCLLDDRFGRIDELSICFDGSDDNINITVLTIVCDNQYMNYYPQDIIQKFTIQNAQEYSIDESGVLHIITGSQNCILSAGEDVCTEISVFRAC